jgi:putative ATP-binding cassette transporter
MVKRWLQVDWRAWLTEQLTTSWLDEARHYRLRFTGGEHDNPDQRIAEDIRIATESAIALAHSLTFSLLTLGLFADILWSVSGSIDLPGTTMHIPGYMVPLAFLYAGLGSVFGWMCGKPLVRATNRLQNAEATYRFGLSRVREHAEAIALMRGEGLERQGAARRFLQVVRGWHKQSMAYLGLITFGTGYGSLLPVLPILVAAPQYIAGTMTLGLLMQAAQAFQQLTSSLSWPVDNIGEIARCRASAERVLSLYEDMQSLDGAAQAPGEARLGLSRGGAILAMTGCAWPNPRAGCWRRAGRGDWARERVLVTGDPAVTGALFRPWAFCGLGAAEACACRRTGPCSSCRSGPFSRRAPCPWPSGTPGFRRISPMPPCWTRWTRWGFRAWSSAWTRPTTGSRPCRNAPSSSWGWPARFCCARTGCSWRKPRTPSTPRASTEFLRCSSANCQGPRC